MGCLKGRKQKIYVNVYSATLYDSGILQKNSSCKFCIKIISRVFSFQIYFNFSTIHCSSGDMTLQKVSQTSGTPGTTITYKIVLQRAWGRGSPLAGLVFHY